MKFSLLFVVSLAMSFSAFAVSNHPVHGYVKKNGKYVATHRQTNPNHTQRDNWSSKGNVNPYTEKEGHKTPQK